MDKASNYFLLTEMFRGMYVVMEQFFRPPYVETSPGNGGSVLTLRAQLHNLLSLREGTHFTQIQRRTRIKEIPLG